MNKAIGATLAIGWTAMRFGAFGSKPMPMPASPHGYTGDSIFVESGLLFTTVGHRWHCANDLAQTSHALSSNSIHFLPISLTPDIDVRVVINSHRSIGVYDRKAVCLV